MNDNGNSGAGGSLIGSDTASINITAVNDRPVVQNPIPDQTLNEDSPWTFTVPANTFVDPEGSSLTFAAALADNSPLPNWLHFDSATRTFTGTPPPNANGSVPLEVVASDGSLSAADLFTLNVIPVNDAPVATGIATLAAIDEDTASPPGATVSVLFVGNFSDAADQVLGGSSANSFVGIAISNHTVDASKGAWQYSTDGGSSWTPLAGATTTAAITLNVADLLRFVPAANYNGAATALSANLIESGQGITSGATLDLTAVDTGGTTHVSSAAVALSETINAVNDAPSGTDKTVTTSEDTAYTFTVGDFGFSDVDGNALQAVKIATLSGAGTLTNNGVALSAGQSVSAADVNAGLLKFAPAANASGASYASFTFQVQDDGGTANGGVDLDPTANTITVDVTPVNDAPVVAHAIADQLATQGNPFSLQFAANTFSDVDGDPLLYTAALDSGPLPAWLHFDGNSRTFSGTPTNADVGTIAVQVTASDGTLSVSDTFNIAVGNANDAPVIQGVGGTVTVVEDNPVLLQAQPAQVTDADGDTLTMTLGVNGGRLTPSQAILDAIASHALTSSDSDGTDGTLSVTGSAAAITAAIQAGITYAPNANVNGLDALDVAITDGQATTNASLAINITPVNDAPVTSPVTLAAIAEDSGPRLITQAQLLVNASDVDGPSPLTAINLQISAGNGTLDDNGNGTWTYHPALNDSTSATFSYSVTDGVTPVTTSASLDIIDTAAPAAVATVTGLSADTGTVGDFITSVASQTVSGSYTGTLLAGEKIQVSTDGNIWIDATAASGAWSASGVTLAAGTGTLSVRTIDAANNTTAGTGHSYTLDQTAPVAAVAITAIATDTGTAGDFITSDTTLVVSGTNGALGAGERVQISSDGSNWFDVTQTTGTTWSYDDAGNPHLSNVTYQVRVIDAAANVGSTASQLVIIDTATPAAGTLSFANLTDTGTPNTPPVTQDNAFGLALAGQETAAGTTTVYQVSVNGGGFANTTASQSALADGSYQFRAVTTDAAGNASTSNIIAVVVDTAAPAAVATVTGLSADTGTVGDFITSVASQTVSGSYTGTLLAGEKIQVSTDGNIWIDATAAVGTWSASGVTLAAGTGALSVRTIDAADNTTPGTGHSYTLQTTGPAAVATVTGLSADTGTVGDFITSVASQTVSGSYTGTLLAGEKIQVSTDGNIWIDATAASGAWSASGVTLAAGTGTLSVRTIDAANNTTAGTGHSYTLDQTAPVAAVAITAIATDTGTAGDFITSDTTLVVSGTNGALGAGERVQISSDGSNWFDVTQTTGTTWSYDDAGNPHLSNVTYQVRVIDAAANVGSTASQLVIIDTATPAAGTLSFANLTDTGTPNTPPVTQDNAFGLALAGQETAAGTTTVYQVSVNGGGFANTTASQSALADGSYQFRAVTTDAAGNASTSNIIAVVVDTAAPAAVATVTGLSADTGTVGDFITSVASQTVSGSYTGTLLAGEKIQVSTDGNIWIDATAAVGTWSASGVTLAAGTGALSVRTIDAADNTTPGTGHSYTLTITGDNNDNVLVGTPGIDWIEGLGGHDTLQGLAGNDLLDGGSGLDRAIYTDATGPITVNLAAGTASGSGVGADTLVSIEQIRGSAFADSYVATGYTGVSPIGSTGANFNEFEGMAGDDTITGNSGTQLAYLNATAGVTVNFASWAPGQGASGTATGDASVGTDTFTGVQGVRGSAFIDTLVGSDNFSAETFQGRGGDDFIDGRGGFDRALYWFRTDDNVTNGVDIHLAQGDVFGDASVGHDTLRSIESVRATDFDDTYNATGFTTTNINGANFGSAGFIFIGSFQAALNEFEGFDGNDTITGNGNTRISYINADDGVTVDFTSWVVGQGASGTAYGTAAGDLANVGTDTFTGVNAVQGSYFADALYGSNNGSSATESFDGGAGNDTIDGRGGFDQAYYNSAVGTVSGINVTVATNNVVGDAFHVVGDASIGTDTLIHIESIRGTNFADTFNATGYNGASADLPNGPTFNEFEGLGGDDIITGNNLTGLAATRLTYGSASAGVTVDLAAHTASGDASVGTDTITGVNRVRGSFFNDTISGDANDNTLEGQGGNDVINGRGGNDTLMGGGGADQLDGGAGIDRALYTDATSAINVNLVAGTVSGGGLGGSDTLVSIEQVRGSASADSFVAAGYVGGAPVGSLAGNFNEFEGMAGNDSITGNGATFLSYLMATAGVTVNFATGSATGDTSVGTDSFTGVQSVRGSEFADNFTGSNNQSGTEAFQGRGGDDIIDGGGGFDRVLYWFRTDDNVTGGINVNMAAGTVVGDISVGSDTLLSIEGLRATNFDDTYDASGFTTTATLQLPNAGSAGFINITNGNTTFQAAFNDFEGFDGNDSITGNGNTRISYINANDGVTVDLDSPTNGVPLSTGIAYGTAAGDLANVGTDTIFGGVNAIQGSYYNDTLYGSNNGTSLTQTFDGGAGDDTIDGRGGFDQVIYNGALGTVSGIDVTVTTKTVAGDAFHVVGDASIGTDTLIHIESIRGTNFADTFNATGYNGASADLPNGPTFNEFEGLGGDDIITGNNLTGLAATRLTYGSASAGVTVDLAAHTASGDASVGTDTITGVNRVRGSFFNDTISGDANDNTLEGQGGNDVINGRGGNDTLTGGSGNDQLDGGDGIDRAIYTDATGPITVNLAAGTASGSGVGNDSTLISIEQIRGSAFADIYVATGYTGVSPIGSFQANANEFEGMAGNDVITGNGATQLSYLNATSSVTVNFTSWVAGLGASGTATGDASVGTDTFTGVQVVRGSEFSDTFHGSNNLTGVENFQGRGGDDLIDGGGGFDRASYWFRTDDNVTGGITVNMAAGTVNGDASVGHDTLLSVEAVRGTNFADTYNATGFTASSTNAGSAGVNNLGAAFNEFEGLGGNDSITGNGNTRVSYINATDAVTVEIATGTAHSTVGDLANVGNDTFAGVNAVQGSYFADTLRGSNNAANTTEFFDGGAGNDTIDGLGGFDQAFYSNAIGTLSGISVNMAAGIVGGDVSIGTDTLRSIESVRGTNFADTYDATGFGQAGALNIGNNGTFNDFEGLAGNDTITGNGNTRVTFVNATGGVTVDVAAGTATGDASVGTDTFTGVSQVRGSQFADTLFGNGSNNTLDGQGGNDILDGRGGNDTLTGGGGADTFVFHSNFLTITDFNQGSGAFNSAEGDLIDITALSINAQQLSDLIANTLTGNQLDFGNGNVIQVTGIDVHTQLSINNFIHS